MFIAARLAAAVTDGDGTVEELRHARQLEEDLEWFIGSISNRPAIHVWKDLLGKLRVQVDEVADSVENETSYKDEQSDGDSADWVEPSAKKKKLSIGLEGDAGPDDAKNKKGDSEELSAEKIITGDSTSHKIVTKEGDDHKEGSAVFDNVEDEKPAVKKERDIDIPETLDVKDEKDPNVVVRQYFPVFYNIVSVRGSQSPLSMSLPSRKRGTLTSRKHWILRESKAQMGW